MIETRGLKASMLTLVGALMAATNPALAQTPVPVTATADPDVTPYAPAFFAEYRPVTALDMIGRIPGFQFDGGTTARGFAGTAGNVLIDGERPPTRSDALSAVLSRIPAAQVLRIDIVRGGAGGIDMQGKAVVANVIRRPDGGVSGSVSVNAGLNDRLDLSPGSGFNIQVQRQRDGRSIDGSLRVNGGQFISDGFRERRAPDGTPLLLGRGDGGGDFLSAETASVYEGPLAGGRIRANVLFNFNASQFERTERLILPFGQERNFNDSDQLRGEAGLRWTRSLPAGMNLELIGFQQLSTGDGVGSYDTPFFTSSTVSERRAGESIVSGALKFAPLATRWGSVSFDTGSEVALNWVESATAFALNAAPVFLPGDDTRVEELRNESFLTGVWTPRAGLGLEGSLRYELSRITATGNAGESEGSYSYLKPRLNLSWAPRPGHQIALKLEKNVDQLSFGAFQASASFDTGIFGRGNPEIRPAQVWLAQARYERVFDRQGSFVAELTHEQIDDVLGQVVVIETPPGGTGPVSFNVTRNVGEATRDTLKLSGRLPLDRYGLVGGLLSGQLTGIRSQTQDPVTLLDRRLSGEQPFGWSVGLSRNLVQRRINWGVNVSSGFDSRNFAPSTLSRLRSDPNFNANISWRPDARLSLSANLNVGADSFSEFTLFNAPRNRGVPIYNERSTNRGHIQASVSARRSF